MRAVSGSTYKVLLTLAEGVLSQDPEFCASLQMSLPKMAEVRELFQRSLETWAALVENKDRQGFLKRMTALKDRLEKVDPDFHKAYENMYKIIEGL
jgi:prephenate dehydrogenase